MHCGVRLHVNLTAASLDIGKCRALMPSHSWKICVRGCPPGPESTDKRCSSSTVNLAWIALRRVADRPPKTLAARLVAVACTMHRAGPRTEACLAALRFCTVLVLPQEQAGAQDSHTAVVVLSKPVLSVLPAPHGTCPSGSWQSACSHAGSTGVVWQ